MTRRFFAAAAAVLLFPTMVLATEATGAAPSPESDAAPATSEAKLVCKRERKTGSHMTSRACRTPEQAEREREAARKLLESNQRGGALDGR